MVRWRKLNLDLNQTCEVFRSHSAKMFHVDEDRKLIRVEAKLTGDPCMVLLKYENDKEKADITDTLLGEDFLWEEIIVEPDF